MSRIGRTPIVIPSNVTVEVVGETVVVKGPKAELVSPLRPGVTVVVEEGKVMVDRTNDEKQTKADHGLVRSLINNNVAGVTTGYKKTLKLIGTGYRVAMKGQGLTLSLGFSHPVIVEPLAGVKLSIEGNDTIFVEGFDKTIVGQMAADIRALKPPEPYRGKGIKYDDEVIRRKVGKAAA